MLHLLDFVDPLPKLIITETHVLFKDSLSQHMIDQFNVDLKLTDFYTKFSHCEVATRKEIYLESSSREKIWFDLIGQSVIYQDQSAVLVYVLDYKLNKQNEIDVARLSRLRALMLEINQSILEIEDSRRFFSLILINGLKALENASLGTIFIKNNDTFEVVSYLGFDKEIENFHLAIEDSFLYRATSGKMDQVVNIPTIELGPQFHPIKTLAGDKVYIKSEICAPIYVNGELYGMISIDALRPNAFDEADYTSMEFIRSSIQIAISNQLMYSERNRMAMHDQLTTLFNRHYFNEQFELIHDKAIRYDETFNLIMFDMDNLKVINDRYGHIVGDQAIKKVAFELQSSMRKSDILARYGGDEFIGICFATDTQKLNEKFKMVENKLIEEQWNVDGIKIPLGFSFGVAQFPTEAKSLGEMIKCADAKLYEQKKLKKEKMSL
jgi:diguanylate cyclase (GGDEF)-like protein